MTTHFLKTWPEPFYATQLGLKTAEFRKDDRSPPFAAGDVLVLEAYEPELGRFLKHPALRTTIHHVARGPHVPEGYALLSHGDVVEVDRREALTWMDDASTTAIQQATQATGGEST